MVAFRLHVYNERALGVCRKYYDRLSCLHFTQNVFFISGISRIP